MKIYTEWKVLNPPVPQWYPEDDSGPFVLVGIMLGVEPHREINTHDAAIVRLVDDFPLMDLKAHDEVAIELAGDMHGLARLMPRRRNRQVSRLWLIRLSRTEEHKPGGHVEPVKIEGRLLPAIQVKALTGTVVPPMLPRIGAPVGENARKSAADELEGVDDQDLLF